MQIKELINNGAQMLENSHIEDSNIKARVLLQYILKKDKIYLVTNCNEEVRYQKEMEYKQQIQELIQGKPLQYITKFQEFMGFKFYVDENVLIPQPDTEILAEEAIKEIEKIVKSKKGNDISQNNTIRILDMCTGSGAIAISIAKYFQNKNNLSNTKNNEIQLKIFGIDISQEALEIAKKNAKSNQVEVEFFISDMFKKMKENTDEPFDIIISNPPYIETDTIKTLSKEVKQEPYIALDGGEDGLNFYRIIAEEGKKYLARRGCILVEIGYNQKEAVTRLFKKENTQITCIKDLAGNNRVIKIQYMLS